jgi:hypothetical protein
MEDSDTHIPPSRQIRSRRNFTTPVTYRPEFCDMLLDYFESAPLTRDGERITQIIESDEPGGRKGKGSLKREVRAICAALPTFEEFARRIGCSSSLLVKWQGIYPDWREAHARAQDIQRIWLYETGLSDRVQPAAWEFVASNCTRFQLRRQPTVEMTIPERIEPDPELAKVSAEDLERARGLAHALTAGFTSEERKTIDRLLAARAERTRIGDARPVFVDDEVLNES